MADERVGQEAAMPLARCRVLAVVLAGGQGGRMGVLTEGRSKPALPFAGTHRLIDFSLSNCANSGIDEVWVVQQYEPHSLVDHLANGRPWDLDRTFRGLKLLSPFEGGEEAGWHQGNADALWRHRRLLREAAPDVVLVLSADAIYAYDYADLIEHHLDGGADVTMLTTRLVGESPERFGVVERSVDGRVSEFRYKPEDPATDVVTTEVFAYRPGALLDTLDELSAEAGDEGLQDFGHGLLPRLVANGSAAEHRFEGYWRDVGQPESYWQAHQDLLGSSPVLDLDDPAWPIRTLGTSRLPAQVLRSSQVEDSFLAPGCRISGRVTRSVLGLGAMVAEGAEVHDSVLLHGARVEAGAVVQRAIVDVGVTVGRGAQVGAAGAELAVLGARVEIDEGSVVPPGAQLHPSRSRPFVATR